MKKSTLFIPIVLFLVGCAELQTSQFAENMQHQPVKITAERHVAMMDTSRGYVPNVPETAYFERLEGATRHANGSLPLTTTVLPAQVPLQTSEVNSAAVPATEEKRIYTVIPAPAAATPQAVSTVSQATVSKDGRVTGFDLGAPVQVEAQANGPSSQITVSTDGKVSGFSL